MGNREFETPYQKRRVHALSPSVTLRGGGFPILQNPFCRLSILCYNFQRQKKSIFEAKDDARHEETV